MKAVFFTAHGGNDVLTFGERPDPVPGAGEVLVRIEAAALNGLDVFVRNGIPGVPVTFPHVPGADGTGVVEALGAGVKGPAPGTRVVLQPGLSCGTCEFCVAGERSLCVSFRILGEHVPGTFAEKIAVPRANVYPAPDRLSPEKAAAFPLVGLTAWRMLVTRAALRPGETVLVHGVGGGVSTIAVQIAKLCGASRIFVTSSSEEKLKKARELGVDVVVDSVGAATWRQSLTAAAKKGRIVTCGATSGPNPEEELRTIFWKQLTILGSTMGTDAEFAAMLAAVAAGRLGPPVDTVFPLADAGKAYERMASGTGFGKIVLKMNS